MESKFEIWDYYEKLDSGKAKCLIGKKCKAEIGRPNGGTSGMRSHLENVHKMSLSELNKP